MSKARNAILSRLKRPNQIPTSPPEDWSVVQRDSIDRDTLLDLFQLKFESVKGEVIRVQAADGNKGITDAIRTWMDRAGFKRLKVGLSPLAQIIEHSLSEDLFISRYDQPIEILKEQLFNEKLTEVGLTGSVAMIAETGSIIVWPNHQEPRTLSLVPTAHICVCDAEKLYPNLYTCMRDLEFHQALPTNALMISGPSKSADIAQVLAYGVHGPKRMVVIVRV
ncbi:lactate utilization protein [Litorivicinus sp.]|jgi:L-lactate dehydrogenase complex protein LldG|nr:lactate utilization protein [Litorivicinus sp.]MDB9863539.1 lactate utilization protein [Litorivicinus sp.]MDC1240675.1 lactate utilization protein [Litorivicinus sp.]